MTKFWTLALWLILMWGDSAPIEARAVGCLANIRLSQLTGAAPIPSCVSGSAVQIPQSAGVQAKLGSQALTPTPLTPPGPTTTPSPTLTSGAPVELKLVTLGSTDRGAMNSPNPPLFIGNKLIDTFCVSGMVTVCTLTAAQFASVADGDEVILGSILGYGSDVWLFGPLNKHQLVMKELLSRYKQRAFNALTWVRASVTDPQQGAALDRALQQLTRANTLAHWRDEWHLRDLGDLAALDADILALTDLQAVVDAAPGSSTAIALRSIMGDIARVDGSLAGVAYAEAAAAGGTPSELDQVKAEFAQTTTEDLLGGKYLNLGTHLRNAWQHAMKAMQSVTPAPTLTPSTTVTPAVTPGQG